VQSRRKPTDSPVPGKVVNTEFKAHSSEWNGVDRRHDDRRGTPTRPLVGIFGPRRRTQGQRETDRIGYVDRYSRHEAVLILTIFVLNVGDAFFTMLWLDRGGREANPLMDFFLDIGPGAFLAQKCIVVGGWLFVLLVHKNFRFARIGLYTSLTAYAVLMIIHFGIIALGITPPDPQDVPRSELILERISPQADDHFGANALAVDDYLRPIIRRVDRPEAE
jgi:hypothetical protein